MSEPNEFERKVMKASLYSDNGDPIKDVMDNYEIEEAVRKLADIYTVIFGLPEDLMD